MRGIRGAIVVGENKKEEIDPLDEFLDQIEGQTDFSLFIED